MLTYIQEASVEAFLIDIERALDALQKAEAAPAFAATAAAVVGTDADEWGEEDEHARAHVVVAVGVIAGENAGAAAAVGGSLLLLLL